mgnify:CR=1 FL=1
MDSAKQVNKQPAIIKFALILVAGFVFIWVTGLLDKLTEHWVYLNTPQVEIECCVYLYAPSPGESIILKRLDNIDKSLEEIKGRI